MKQLSRAENARQRRAQRAERGLLETKQRATRSVVTSRISAMPVMAQPKRGSKKRRFDSAFLLPDTGLQKPFTVASLFYWDWRRTSALIAVLFCVSIYLALTLPYFHVSNADVLGNIRVSAEEINAALGVTGQSIFMVQPEEAEARLLMNYHELASAQVNVDLPHHVTVTVTEREPVILWQQDGGYTWIDSAGVAFRPRGLAEGLVLVNGLGAPSVNIQAGIDPLNPAPFIQKGLVDAILALAPAVPADSAMIFDPSYGLGWKDSRGWNAFFGATEMDDMPMKAVVYQALVKDLLERGKIPEFISVAYPDAPFYRMADNGSSQTEGNGQ